MSNDTEAAFRAIGRIATDWADGVSERMATFTRAVNESMDAAEDADA